MEAPTVAPRNDDFLQCLLQSRASGKFASLYSPQGQPHPGLHVDGVGLIRLPIAEDDARAIARVASATAPDDQGQSQSKSRWVLPCTSFRCENPAWEAFIEGLRTKALTELGIGPEEAKIGVIRINPRSVIVWTARSAACGPSAIQTPTTAFASVGVCLPSKHEGGDITLCHGNEEKVFETARGSEYETSACAWYRDVSCVSGELMSGCRVMLVYDLVKCATGPNPSLEIMTGSRDRLKTMFRAWEQRSSDKFLVYALENRYEGEDEVFEKNLVGGDINFFETLRDVCSFADVHVFLGKMIRTVFGTRNVPYSESDEVSTKEESIKVEIVSPAGVELGSCPLRMDQILQSYIYQDREADEELEDDLYPVWDMTGEVKIGTHSFWYDWVSVMFLPGLVIDASAHCRAPRLLS